MTYIAITVSLRASAAVAKQATPLILTLIPVLSTAALPSADSVQVAQVCSTARPAKPDICLLWVAPSVSPYTPVLILSAVSVQSPRSVLSVRLATTWTMVNASVIFATFPTAHPVLLLLSATHVLETSS